MLGPAHAHTSVHFTRAYVWSMGVRLMRFINALKPHNISTRCHHWQTYHPGLVPFKFVHGHASPTFSLHTDYQAAYTHKLVHACFGRVGDGIFLI